MLQESVEGEQLRAVRFDHLFHFAPPHGSIRTANLEPVRPTDRPALNAQHRWRSARQCSE
jgi:hypothetical protein